MIPAGVPYLIDRGGALVVEEPSENRVVLSTVGWAGTQAIDLARATSEPHYLGDLSDSALVHFSDAESGLYLSLHRVWKGGVSVPMHNGEMALVLRGYLEVVGCDTPMHVFAGEAGYFVHPHQAELHDSGMDIGVVAVAGRVPAAERYERHSASR